MAKRGHKRNSSSESASSASAEEERPPIHYQKGTGKEKRLPGKRLETRRAWKRSEVELGANGAPKGEFTHIDGKFYFRDKDFYRWTRGEHHETYRRRFLQEDDRNGSFSNNIARGQHELDRTSFINYQRHWGKERVQWQNIVDQSSRKFMLLPQRPADWPGQHAGFNWWTIDDGVVLLDQDNHPLRDIPGLNRTFSTAIEGWHMDALRKLFPKLQVADIRGRMPSTRVLGKQIKPVQGLQAFTNREYRWRRDNGVADWNLRGGSAGRVKPAGQQVKYFLSSSEEKDGTSGDNGPSIAMPQAKAREDEPVLYGKHFTSDFFIDALAPEQRPSLFSPGPSQAGTASLHDQTGASRGASGNQRLSAPTAPQGMRLVLRNQLDPRGRRVYDRQRMREAARLGVNPDSIQLIPLFASPGDRELARLQGSHMTNPWRVLRERRNQTGLATGVFLVMRHWNAPRARDENGNTLDDVAEVTDRQIQELTDMANCGDDQEWLED